MRQFKVGGLRKRGDPMNKEISEEKTSEIAREFFLGEFSFDELQYIPANLSKGDKKELADLVIDYGDNIIAFQIKERRGEPVAGGDMKWVDRKITDAKNQLVNTWEQYQNYEIPQFINGKGDSCSLKINGNYTGIIILYNEAIEEYKRIVSCRRLNGIFHCFSYSDFKLCCEKLIIPRDILEYFDFRAQKIKLDMVCNANEELMTEEFLEEKYGTSKCEKYDLDTFRYFLKEYQNRLVEGDCDQYRNVLQVFLELDRTGIDAFLKRVKRIIDFAKEKRQSDSHYIVPQNRNDSSFLFLSSDGFNKEYIEKLMFVFMYKMKLNKCLSVVAYFEDDMDVRLDWIYIEKEWEYDIALNEICNSAEIRNKWKPALILSNKGSEKYQ